MVKNEEDALSLEAVNSDIRPGPLELSEGQGEMVRTDGLENREVDLNRNHRV